MNSIPQSILNKIAETVPLTHPLTKQLFRMTEDQIDAMEPIIRMKIEDHVIRQTGNEETGMNPARIARGVYLLLPIYLERQAVTRYLNMVRDPRLRNLFPEILDEQEAAELADRELMLTHKEKLWVKTELLSIEMNHQYVTI